MIVLSQTSLVMSLEGKVVETVSGTAMLMNNEYMSLTDEFGHISQDDLDLDDQLYSDGQILVRVSHPSLADDKVFRRSFSITKFLL